MKLGVLLFCAYVVILALCLTYPVMLIAQQVRLVYLEGVEEPLVDTANILAELTGQAIERGELDPEALYSLSARIEQREVMAPIYSFMKERVDLAVYISDRDGRVIFDSRDRGNIGADFSEWIDVSRTLSGKYGARISSDPADPSLPRQLYIAAPIRARGQIIGALSVVKPTTAVSSFVGRLQPRLVALATIAGGAAIMLSLIVSLWVTQQVGRLTRYANEVREGKRVPFPKLARTELREMGLAFENMRESLAGQAYVEQYVRALTHEIKSPISAIRGAAEILESPQLEAAQRERFMRNLRTETQRIQDLVDRMLELSELELRRALPASSEVALTPILRSVLEAQAPQLAHKQLQLALALDEATRVQGDSFQLHLAISNLVSNAIEWSPTGSTLSISCGSEQGHAQVIIEDEGPGIPEYARARVFERFYSLTRPDTGQKSTGLGLNLVREIATLHNGQITLQNGKERGLRATLSLPASTR
jgi:two-component system, OmpR family, sensor histidine kinase CreC